MLAPDDNRLRALLGDETVATTPDDDQPDYSPVGPPPFNRIEGHRVFEPVDFGELSQGDVRVVGLSYPPEAWLIAVPQIADVELEITVAPSDSSVPNARLGPGGYCVLPGRNQYLALRSIGTVAVTPVVNALTSFGPYYWHVCPGVGTMSK